MASTLVNEPSKRLLGMAIIGDQPPVAVRFLDRVEVAALDILQQGDFESLGIVEIANDDRYLVEPSALRRPPAPLAGDDLVAMAVRPDDDRLDQPALLDRGCKLLQRLLVEITAGLVEMRLDRGDRHHLDAAARRLGAPRHRGLLSDLAEQGGEAAAEAGGAFADGDIVAHAAAAVLGRRPISSRAKAI